MLLFSAHEQYTGLMAEQNEESGVHLGPDQEPDGGSLEPLDDGKCLEDKNYACKIFHVKNSLGFFFLNLIGIDDDYFAHQKLTQTKDDGIQDFYIDLKDILHRKILNLLLILITF